MPIQAKMVALCTSRRLGDPRNLQYPGEDRFLGSVCRGLASDNVGLPWEGAHVIVLGMGAYAIEQVRTAFEHLALRVRILCRRPFHSRFFQKLHAVEFKRTFFTG